MNSEHYGQLTLDVDSMNNEHYGQLTLHVDSMNSEHYDVSPDVIPCGRLGSKH